MRQIGAEATRELIGKTQVSPVVGRRKVAIIYEADRMNTAAANIFLKTLEEPPASPPCCCSRPALRAAADHPQPLPAFSFCRLRRAAGPPRAAGLENRLSGLARTPGRRRLRQPGRGRADLRPLRARGALQRHPRRCDGRDLERAEGKSAARSPRRSRSPSRPASPTASASGCLPRSSRPRSPSRVRAWPLRRRHPPRAGGRRDGQLERCTGLLRLNLNESAALEEFLLASLRLWTRR
jgi:DNA polymerase-3 subunit delta'